MAANINTRDKAADTSDLGVLPDTALAPVYGQKAHVLNAAIQKIGMGKYQWELFCVAGFGWLCDSVCLPVCKETECWVTIRRDSSGRK